MPILKPTIIVLADGAQAKLFYADNDEFRHLKDIKADTSHKPSGEGHARAAAGTAGVPTDDTDQMHWEGENRKHLYAQLNDALRTKLLNKEAEDIIICISGEHKNELAEKLAPDVSKHVTRTVNKNLVNHPLDRIIEAIEV